MKIIVCIDDKNGMMFNHRRQSKDREVRRDMLSYIGQHRLWMNEYSRKQFEAVPKDAQIEVNENFPAFAGDDDYCFIENSIYLLNKNLITEIVIYVRIVLMLRLRKLARIHQLVLSVVVLLGLTLDRLEPC